jgi:hypothetical protein
MLRGKPRKLVEFWRLCAERQQEAWVLGILWASYIKSTSLFFRVWLLGLCKQRSGILDFESFGSDFKDLPLKQMHKA